MIIKVWLGLAILGAIFQIVLAYKTSRPSAGFILPVFFLCFAVYALIDLASIGISMLKISSFFIPPIFLTCLFFLFYWKKRWNECRIK